MREINICKVIFNNYTCYTDETEYEFHNGSLQLIVGINGSGKSNLFNSLCVCFYGTSPDGRRGDDFVNNKIKKDCYIFTYFEVNNENYVCKRYIKHHKEGTNVILYKGDESIAKGHREVVPMIETLFMPIKLFTSLLYLTQKGEIFMELDNSAQKEIFKKLLNYEIYQQYSENADKKTVELEAEINEVKSKIDVCNELIKQSKNQLIELEEQEQDFEKRREDNIKRLHNEISVLENEKITLENKLNITGEDYSFRLLEITQELNSIQNALNNNAFKKQSEKEELIAKKDNKLLEFKTRFSEEVASITDIKIKAKENLKPKDLEITDLEKKISDLKSVYREKINQKSSILGQFNDIDEKITDIRNSLDQEIPKCYVCGKNLENDVNKIRALLIAKESKKETFDKALKELGVEIEDISTQGREHNEVLKNLITEYSAEVSRIDAEFQEKSNDLTHRLNVASERLNVFLTDKLNEINNKFCNDEKELVSKQNVLRISKKAVEDTITNNKTLETALNAVRNKIFETGHRLTVQQEALFDKSFKNSIDKNILKYENDRIMLIEGLDVKTKQLKMYEFWKIGFSMKGIPSILIEESIPFINDRLNFYLDQIGGRYRVSFDVLSETKKGDIRDKINIKIFDTKTHADARDQLSGGQKRLIDTVIILTLRNLMQEYNGVKINIVLFDEIFDSLDEDNIGIVSNLIRGLVGAQSFNIISHRHIDQIEYDEIYKLS